MQKFPFLGFCLMPENWKKKTFVPVDHFLDFNLESSTIIIKNMFIMKNLTDFRKTVETGLDPRLSIHKLKAEEMHFRAFSFSLLLARTLRGKIGLLPHSPLNFQNLR